MWNARRNGRWFGWGCLFLSCSILLFRSAAVLRKNHFLEGKVLLQRAAAQAEQLSVDVMMPLLFMTEKRTEGDGWKISSRQCGIRYRRFGREARQKIRCLPGQKQRKRIRRSRIRFRDREQKEGRQNRRSRELRKIKRMELKR